MTNKDKQMVLVSVEALETILNGFLDIERNRKPYSPTQKEIKHASELEDVLRNHKRVVEGPHIPQLGDIVRPKEGRNYLRAGDTAYGQAIVMGLDPFFIVSADGRRSWHKVRSDDFDIVGKISDMELTLLRVTHLKIASEV